MVWAFLSACILRMDPPAEDHVEVPVEVSVEVCDGVDNDGDGLVDDDDPSLDPDSGFLVYYDRDLDGYGQGAVQILRTCEAEGMSTLTGDCNDGDAAIFPGAPEVCNGVDDDCDGWVDGDDRSCDRTTAHLGYTDEDEDGYAGTPSLVCGPREASDATPGDCDDASADVYPGALDRCDGVDNSCQGSETGCVPATAISGPYVTAGAEVTGAVFGTDATGSWVALGAQGAGELNGYTPSREGAAYVLTQPTDAVDAALVASATIVGDWDQQGMGAVLGSPGDLDGDGLADLLVEARSGYSYRGEWFETGNVSLYLGPLAGDLQPLWTFAGPDPCGEIDGGLDVTGDGRPDVVLDANRVVRQSTKVSGLALLDGAAAGTLGTDDVLLISDIEVRDVLLHPDIDGDGQGDLILGTDVGTLAVPGPIDADVAWPDLTAVVLDADGSKNLVLLSDVDGDGAQDIAAQTDGLAVISSRGGRRAAFSLEGDDLHATPIDDLDADGYAEIAVGDWAADLALRRTGAVWIFSGAAEGNVIDNDALALLPGSEEYQYLGTALAWTPGTLLIGDATGAWFVDTSTILAP